jgi:CRP/FNR family cyclic AMP-dependent transcriptional regulator
VAHITHLEGTPLLTEEEMVHLESVGQTLHRDEGHTFFLEGEETDYALLIKKGHVKVVMGTRPHIITIRGPGSLVGEMAALWPQPRTASVIAIDVVEVLHLPAGAWRKFLFDNRRAMYAQLVFAYSQIYENAKQIVNTDLAAEQRLAKTLLDLTAQGVGKSTARGTALPFSQQDLAALSGASLDSIKKIVRTFREQKMIATGRQVLYILDDRTLTEIANGNRTAIL